MTYTQTRTHTESNRTRTAAAHLDRYLVVKLLLKGGSEVRGHLSDGVAGGVAHPRVLGRETPKFKPVRLQQSQTEQETELLPGRSRTGGRS